MNEVVRAHVMRILSSPLTLSGYGSHYWRRQWHWQGKRTQFLRRPFRHPSWLSSPCRFYGSQLIPCLSFTRLDDSGKCHSQGLAEAFAALGCKLVLIDLNEDAVAAGALRIHYQMQVHRFPSFVNDGYYHASPAITFLVVGFVHLAEYGLSTRRRRKKENQDSVVRSNG